MKDYTANIYCDCLWINDLLELKKNNRNKFEAKIQKNNLSFTISIVNVTVFGTIVEIKQIGQKNYLYYVDDGTGVIACKHNEDQFEEAISIIEREQEDILNQTVKFSSNSMDQSSMTDASMEDSIFNEKSIQDDELGIIKKNLLDGLQSIWNDIYDSFTNLLAQYKIGDTVLIDGKLYSYFNTNQIYINSIRPLSWSEEIVKVSNKLKDGYKLMRKRLLSKPEHQTKRRCSGLMTFDSIDHVNVKIPTSRPLGLQRDSFPLPKDLLRDVLPPQIESTMTFDTFDDHELRLSPTKRTHLDQSQCSENSQEETNKSNHN